MQTVTATVARNFDGASDWTIRDLDAIPDDGDWKRDESIWLPHLLVVPNNKITGATSKAFTANI